MGQIDVTDLLVDPTFVDPIQVISRVPTVDSFGQNSLMESTLNTYGSVQPATGRSIARIPEALRVANMSNFWYKGEIVASAAGEYATILVFNGQRYQVKNVFDYSNWGQGFCEGLCVGEVPAP
jgi:hypothetical protein